MKPATLAALLALCLALGAGAYFFLGTRESPEPAALPEANSQTANAKPYPLDVCIVSDEKFGGDMGKPIVFVRDGQEYKLCCDHCQPEFDKDPAKFVAKLSEAAKPK